MFIKLLYSASDSRRFLLGILLALAMLDHTRMFFYHWNSNPVDIDHTTLALYLTRFLSHFFAPAIFFLLGIEICLYSSRFGVSKLNQALFRTGIVLLLLEFLVNNFLYTFDPYYRTIGLFILGLLGLSFFCMIGLQYFGRSVIIVISMALIIGHNLLDKIRFEEVSIFGICWSILHQQNFISFHQRMFIINYTLIPWLGVLLLGYYFGKFYHPTSEPDQRKRILRLAGCVSVGLFVLLRILNSYGDSVSWQYYPNPMQTVLSFLNMTKYPASPAFLSLTLGVVLLFLAYTTDVKFSEGNFFCVLARKPLFIYLFSTLLIHFGAMLSFYFAGGDPMAMVITAASYAKDSPLAQYGYSIQAVYGIWIIVLLILYYVMRKRLIRPFFR